MNGSHVPGHTAPKNIGGDPATGGHPIYYFAPVAKQKPKAYVLYLPPAHGA